MHNMCKGLLPFVFNLKYYLDSVVLVQGIIILDKSENEDADILTIRKSILK